MKKFIKNNIKVISAIIVTAVLCISGTVYATTKYLSSDVTYKDTTVESALNDLYEKSSRSIKFITNCNDSNVTTYNNVLVDNTINYKYLIVVISTSNRVGKNLSTMDSLINLECDGAIYLGKNGAYIGNDSSSHITKIYMIPVTGNSITITKITGWSYSIYGI